MTGYGTSWGDGGGEGLLLGEHAEVSGTHNLTQSWGLLLGEQVEVKVSGTHNLTQ